MVFKFKVGDMVERIRSDNVGLVKGTIGRIIKRFYFYNMIKDPCYYIEGYDNLLNSENNLKLIRKKITLKNLIGGKNKK